MLGPNMATFSPVQAFVGRSVGKSLFARSKRLMAIGLVGTSMAILGLEATIWHWFGISGSWTDYNFAILDRNIPILGPIYNV